MLTIRYENGRMKYSYQPKKSNNYINDSTLSLAPLPTIYHSEQNMFKRLKFRQWYSRKYQHVDDITDILLEAFKEFLETHPVYYVQFDEELFRQHMAYRLYMTSFSAYRDFP